MADKPFLSVIMPVHDGMDWIEATLASVASEPTEGLEVIVIDSTSDDSTATIVARYADRMLLHLLRRPDVKPWQTKTNLGLSQALADHACILHQDDLWLPGRVKSVRSWIARAPEAVLHLAPSRLIDRDGHTVGRWRCPLPPEQELDPQALLQRLLVQNFVSVPAPLFRRTPWLECGGMDEQLWYTPDWDIWVKLSLAGPVVYHDETTTAFRLHGSSLTVTGSRDASDFRAQMETVLDRHLGEISSSSRKRIERIARTSIDVNVSLAAASNGSATALARAAGNLLSLGPIEMRRYLRDSRLGERAISRLRARMMGVF